VEEVGLGRSRNNNKHSHTLGREDGSGIRGRKRTRIDRKRQCGSFVINLSLTP
jgi:hypothetical protein